MSIAVLLFYFLAALSSTPAGTSSGKYKDFSIRGCIKYLESYHLPEGNSTSPTYHPSEFHKRKEFCPSKSVFCISISSQPYLLMTYFSPHVCLLCCSQWAWEEKQMKRRQTIRGVLGPRLLQSAHWGPQIFKDCKTSSWKQSSQTESFCKVGKITLKSSLAIGKFIYREREIIVLIYLETALKWNHLKLLKYVHYSETAYS